MVTSRPEIKTVKDLEGKDLAAAKGTTNWVMFDCASKVCPGRLTGTIAAQTNPPGNWRYRKYETVIPLRNSIWNRF